MITRARDLGEVRDEVAGIDKCMVSKNNECKEVKIDKNIRGLIIGLRRWHIETLESCGGHRFPIGFRSLYPFVRFPKEEEPLLNKILEAYEDSADWVIDSTLTGDYLLLHPRLKRVKDGFIFIPNPHLSGYQKAAKKFGEWLQSIPEDFFEDKQ
jgi:hypothetical protein